MATKIKEEMQSDFKDTGEVYAPRGKLGKFFAKFFADKIEPELDLDKKGVHGDTVKNPESVKKKEGVALPGWSGHRTLLSSQIELNRKRRYEELERMDEYPELSAAFDIYADDCTQKDTKGKRWKIVSESNEIIDEVERLFDRVKLNKHYWDIIRAMVKFGDSFIEITTNLEQPEMGIQRIKVLSPVFIKRVENEYGYLDHFIQEIPKNDTFSSWSAQEQEYDYIELDKNQIIHFRILNSDPKYYPYGKSIANSCIRVFKSLKLMEDAMMIYRLVRAPERRIFYIDIGNLPASKAEVFIEKVKEKFKKEKYYNSQYGTLDARMNPQSVEEDFFVPVRGNKGTKIETLPGAENLGEVDDVKYFRDKLLAALKIPKDFIVEQNAGAEKKANLSQLDIKFARVIARMQLYAEDGLEILAKKHLLMIGADPELVERLKIELPDPSDLITKRKLDVEEQRARVVQTVQQLAMFTTEDILMSFYGMSEEEAAEQAAKAQELEQEKKEQELEMQMASMAAMGGAPGEEGGAQPPVGMPGKPKINKPPYGSAGGQESPKNSTKTPQKRPKSKKEEFSALKKLKFNARDSKSRVILERIEKRLRNTEKEEIED